MRRAVPEVNVSDTTEIARIISRPGQMWLLWSATLEDTRETIFYWWQENQLTKEDWCPYSWEIAS